MVNLIQAVDESVARSKAAQVEYSTVRREIETQIRNTPGLTKADRWYAIRLIRGGVRVPGFPSLRISPVIGGKLKHKPNVHVPEDMLLALRYVTRPER